MSIDLHDACTRHATNLDAILDEAGHDQYALRAGDVYELVQLAQTCLEAAARIAIAADALTNGQAGLVQATNSTLRGEPIPDGLELDAISQIVTMVQTGQRVAS